QNALEKGRYREAEEQWQAARAVAEGFGPQDPRLGTTLSDLGRLYALQGRYAEAEPLYRRAAEIWTRAWGPEHPAVGKVLENLAMLQHTEGRYAEAAPLYEQALAIKRKALGE